MPDITLSIPEDVYKKMREHKGISWAEVVRKAIVDYVYRLEVGKQELTTEELLKELGKEFAEGLSEISFEEVVEFSEKMRVKEWKGFYTD